MREELGTDPRPFDLLTAVGPQTPQPGKPMPIKVEKVAGQAGQGDGPNMPPPDQSPKLSTDLMASLQQDPPPPDESPT